MNHALGQFFTPSWATEMLLRRHFGGLTNKDVVLEPSCGDGRFLMAVPSHVRAYGVEIDPVMAAKARANSGRTVIEGDFLGAKLPVKPTAIIGNPPFQADFIDGLLGRAFEELDYGQRVGLLLPVYYLQTASKVVDISRQFSIEQELLPRNLFAQMSKPLMWANFTKARKTVLSGFFLYEEVDSLAALPKQVRERLVGNDAGAHCWRDVVELALVALNGQGTLEQIYAIVEGAKPTANPWWREQVRKVLGKSFVRVGRGEYSLHEGCCLAMAA